MGTVIRNMIEHQICIGLLIFVYIACVQSYNYSRWITSTQTIPNTGQVGNMHGSPGMIAAYFNGIIHLFGGYNAQTQWREYDIQNDSFDNNTTTDILGTMEVYETDSEFYTQINHIIYWISRDGKEIIVYNLQTKQFGTSGVIIMPQETRGACITSHSSEHLLYITGGQVNGRLNTVTIYDISNNEWLPSIPTMQQARSEHSCVFDPIRLELWVIAGRDASALSSVEKLTHNRTHWHYAQDMNVAVYRASSALFDDFIIVMGGKMNAGTTVDTVQVIECSTAGIMVEGVQYLFGGVQGCCNNFGEDCCEYGDIGENVQYLNLTAQTQKPTQSPTSDPRTDIPSQSPSGFVMTSSPTMQSLYIHTYNTDSTNDDIPGTSQAANADNNDNGLVAIVFLIVFICLSLMLCGYYFNRRRNKMTSNVQQTIVNDDMIQTGKEKMKQKVENDGRKEGASGNDGNVTIEGEKMNAMDDDKNGAIVIGDDEQMETKGKRIRMHMGNPFEDQVVVGDDEHEGMERDTIGQTITTEQGDTPGIHFNT
eukprot:13573_1